MFETATPEKAVAFTELCVAFSCCWPPPSDATRSQILLFKVLRIIAFANALTLLLALLYALHVYRNNIDVLTKAAMMASAVAQPVFQTVLCTTQYSRFQRLIEQMRVSCREANSHERQILQQYVDKYAAYYGSSATWFYASAITVIFSTFFISDPFPTNAEYPFPVDFEPVKSIIFVHQAIAGIQCSAHLCMNVFCALLLLFAAARFQMLTAEMVDINGIASLVKCVKKYRVVRGYALEAVRGMRLVIITTYTFVFLACGFNGIIIIGVSIWSLVRAGELLTELIPWVKQKTTLTAKVRAAMLLSVGLLEAFMCALPADHLMEMSDRAMQGAYKSGWSAQSLSVQKCLLVMTVPQPPVAVNIQCVIPALSLNYFCSFVSNIFSVFAALRVMLTRNEND